jgi:tetratricopeptide (TPR) repeat protein
LIWILLAVAAYIFNIRPLADSQSTDSTTQPLIQRTQDTSNLLTKFNRLQFGFILFAVMILTLFTWEKTISYTRAARAMANAHSLYAQGYMENSLYSANKAIQLAPDVATYYLFKNIVLNTFLHHRSLQLHTDCLDLMTENENPNQYIACLKKKIHENAVVLIEISPYNWRSTFNLADSFSNLEDYANSYKYYEKTLALISNSWVLHNKVAEAYIASGMFKQAKDHLIDSLSVTEKYSYPNKASELIESLP